MADEKSEEKDLETTEEEQDSETKPEEEEEAQEPDSKEESKEEEDEEPKLRKSAKDYIIERKNKQLEKAKKEEDGEDDFSAKFDKEFERRFGHIQKTIKSSADEAELGQVVSKYEDASKYEKRIRRYMDVYDNVPVESLYWMIKGQEKRTGDKEKADEAAKANSVGGSTRRPKEAKLPDFSKMDDEAFIEWDKEQARNS